MRKSAINQRIDKNYLTKGNSKSHNQDLNFQNLKFEPSKIPENNYMSSRTPLPYYHPKNIKQLMHRPYTTQKNQSYIQLRKSHAGLMNRQEPVKELSVSTMRENRDYRDNIHTQDNNRFEHTKGRLFRGSSWKYDDKPFKDLNPISSRYHHHLQHKRDSSAHQPLQNDIKARRSSGLVDILGQNLRKSEVKNQEDFLEYIMRFSYRTKKGYIPTNSGKVNQDNYIVNPNLNNQTWQHFFAVCDGHGPLGHQVSSYIKNTLPQAINNAKGIDRHPREALTKAFQTAYDKLLKDSRIDLSFSGSTVIACYFNNNRLLCANVGDSRAIMGRSKSGKWETVSLSSDHKPSVQKEAERIKKMKGRVQAFKDEYGDPIGPLRVWVQGDNVPGLAMTRSFGDLVGASVGVSPIPQIKQFSLTESDRILVIASDGIFQFLQNQTIINSLIPFYESKQIQQASDHLMSLATKAWTKNSSIVDDITFILIFISYNEI